MCCQTARWKIMEFWNTLWYNNITLENVERGMLQLPAAYSFSHVEKKKSSRGILSEDVLNICEKTLFNRWKGGFA